ncbi:Diacylglycerol kinase family enzyme [Roseivivax halotolerans]|uniref:Diacylglycerol kinase family enzyme n=1 Tax=Roseivivax halotolerans TaxID=93684 RepID=A0A1I5YCT3_9RHOB|nr:diacylglycerol kinase family protein [Roseivivax halotolerans]SFQ41973.1 Diacylglycerol kinase family enzyme [Roseivivax halotolerans]
MSEQKTDNSNRIAVLLNRASGADDKDGVADRLKAAFAEHGDRFELFAFEKGDRLIPECRRAMKAGYGTIVAAGGDGTISGVAQELAGSGHRMGIIPQGTFNFVARGLGIPEDPEEAVALLASGEARPFPLGEVNGYVFVNNASLGVYPQVLKEREGTYKRWGRSRLAAHWSVIVTFLTFRRPVQMKVRVGGREVRRKTPLAFIGRSAFQLEHYGLEGADAVRDGAFALYLSPEASRWELLMRALKLASKGMVLNRDFELFTGTDIVIETSRKSQSVAMDGERRRIEGPFRFRMLNDALDVVAPSAAGPKNSEAGDEREA